MLALYTSLVAAQTMPKDVAASLAKATGKMQAVVAIARAASESDVERI